MKGLYRYLSPFAPDISGAVAVLYELGGIIIICDAGGCAGNTCGFDEPRWFQQSSAIYSAGLRDLDAILGRDDRLLDKIDGAVHTTPATFIALIGTPVPSVIATDYQAICKLCEKRFGLPSLYIETTGMNNYDAGQIKAYKAILKKVKEKKEGPYTYGIWGATPMDIPALDSIQKIQEAWNGPSICFGMGSNLDAFSYASSVKENLVVSPSGLKIAKLLYKKYHIPYHTAFSFSSCSLQGKVLILHQQVLANAIRKAIGHGQVASFFVMDKTIMEEDDQMLKGENDLIRLVKENNYDCILGDPLYQRALSFYTGKFIPLPQFAVSGQMYAADSDADYWKACGLW